MTRRLVRITWCAALLAAAASCEVVDSQSSRDPELETLLRVLKLVDSGRGCGYIEMYLVPGGVTCTEALASGPVLTDDSGQRLDLRTFRSWYAISPQDFERQVDILGPFYVEKRSGMAFRIVDGKLAGFWQIPQRCQRCHEREV